MLEMEENMEDFLGFMAEILETDQEKLTLETTQEEVETWDSLMQLRLVGEVETKYGVTIPMDAVSTITTLGGFYQFVK